MKKFIGGFLAGAMLFGSIGAFAVQYAANPVDFKVLVNGKEFTSDPPALEVNGRTYLPLRAIGDALGVPVTWNEELRQAEVGNSAPVAVENEYSRTNPAPINTVQTYEKGASILGNDAYSLSIRVEEIKRGNEAMKFLKNASDLNDYPEDENYEYVVAKIALSVLDIDGDGAFNVGDYYFKSFSSGNEELPSTYAYNVTPELTGKLYAGGNTEGWITVLVKKDDPEPKLAYGLDYNGKGGIWFKLYE